MSYCDEAQTQAHHWVLEGASGPTSRGICIHCKVEKEHFNYVPVSYTHLTLPTILRV